MHHDHIDIDRLKREAKSVLSAFKTGPVTLGQAAKLHAANPGSGRIPDPRSLIALAEADAPGILSGKTAFESLVLGPSVCPGIFGDVKHKHVLEMLARELAETDWRTLVKDCTPKN